MKCPKCGEEMKEVKKDESANTQTGKKYSRTMYHCESDDIWLNLEIPKTQ
jgi:hypothetical protein